MHRLQRRGLVQHTERNGDVLCVQREGAQVMCWLFFHDWTDCGYRWQRVFNPLTSRWVYHKVPLKRCTKCEKVKDK
jgi:hypothetical protein